jgi:hypothetical protein
VARRATVLLVVSIAFLVAIGACSGGGSSGGRVDVRLTDYE